MENGEPDHGNLSTIIYHYCMEIERTNSADLEAIRQEALRRHPEHADMLRDHFENEDFGRMLAVSNGRREEGAVLRKIAGYTLIDLIGSGGSGEVYKARHDETKRVVALKTLQLGRVDDETLARLENEFRVIAGLDHPNIIEIYDYQKIEGNLYYTMRYVEGDDLNRRLREFQRDPVLAARIVLQIAEAIRHAHQRNVLHRDLKPSNVMLDKFNKVYVCDFGLAKRLGEESDLTATGAILGTPSYMSPEQALGEKDAISELTDIYGIGAILYALLAGKPPFDGGKPSSTIRLVADREPTPPTKFNPMIPRDLEVIRYKAMERDPRRRYASAGELADDLRRFIEGRPIRARSVSWPTRVSMWARREPVLSSLAGGLFVTLIVAIVVVSLALRETLKERNLKEKERISAESARKAAELNERKARELAQISGLRLAYQHWRHGDVRNARQFFDDYRSGPVAPTGVFQFAWGRLDRIARPARGIKIRKDVRPAFSPDGRSLVCVEPDRSITLLDTQYYSRIYTELISEDIEALAFVDGGKTLIGYDSTGDATVWEVEPYRLVRLDLARGSKKRTGGEVAFVGESLVFVDRKGGIAGSNRLETRYSFYQNIGDENATAEVRVSRGGIDPWGISADGGTLAVGSRDGRIEFFDGSRWETRSEWKIGFAPASLALDRSGSTVAVADSAGSIFVLDRGSKKQNQLAGHVGAARSLAFAPDGLVVVSAGDDGVARVWNIQNQESVNILRGHERPIVHATFSPDGLRVATVDDDGLLCVRDARERLESESLVGSTAPAGPIAVSPDGGLIAVAARDHSLRLLDSADLGEYKHQYGDISEIISIKFSPKGEMISTLSTSGIVTSRYVQPRKYKYREDKIWSRSKILAMDYIDERGTIATVCDDGVLRFWEVESGREIDSAQAHRGAITSLATDPKTRRAATSGVDHEIKIWKYDDHDRLKGRTIARDLEVKALAFAPDGERLAAIDPSGDVLILNGEGSIDRKIGRLRSGVHTIVFSPDGSLLATEEGDFIVRLWNWRTGELFRELWNNGEQGIGLAFSPRDGAIYCVGRGEMLKVWDAKTWDIRAVMGKPSGPIVGLAFDPAGESLLGVVSDSYNVSRFHVPIGPREGIAIDRRVSTPLLMEYDQGAVGRTRRISRSLMNSTGYAIASARSADERVLAISNEDGQVIVYDIASRSIRSECFLRNVDKVYRNIINIGIEHFPIKRDYSRVDRAVSVALSPNGETLATLSGRDHVVTLWDVRSREAKAIERLPKGPGVYGRVAYSPDGDYLAVVDNETQVRLWSIAERRWVATLADSTSPVTSLRFSRDASLLAIGGRGGSIVIWSGKKESGGWSRATERSRLLGHSGVVHSLCFTPDGSGLASGGDDRSIRIWDLNHELELATFDGHAGSVLALEFSRDGGVLASGGSTPAGGGEILLWRSEKEKGPR